MQNTLWNNDKIQRILILGTLNLDKFTCTEQTIRNLENFKKIIKSQTIKKQIYNNRYFVYIIMTSNKIESRFFHSFDLKKVFDGVVQSQEFNLLPNDKKYRVIEKLNSYTKDLLLPNNFRDEYKNIESILISSDRDNIDSSIIEQLNADELFLLDYINDSIEHNKAIKEYLINNIKNNNKSFEEFFLIDVEKRENLIIQKLCNQIKGSYYYQRYNLKEKYIIFY